MICISVCIRFSIHATYILQMHSANVFASALISFFFQHKNQQSGQERLNWLLCITNLLSSLNIQVKADLRDCQYTVLAPMVFLSYASDPVKFSDRETTRHNIILCPMDAKASRNNAPEVGVWDYLKQINNQKSALPLKYSFCIYRIVT